MCSSKRFISSTLKSFFCFPRFIAPCLKSISSF
jgi:hypothetical protein